MTRPSWDRLAGRLAAHPAVWSVRVRSDDHGPSVDFEFQSDRELRSASTAKILVLLATAKALVEGRLSADQRIDRRDLEPVADSGIWWHLRQRDLAIADLAALTGMASDNLATNALIGAVGGVKAVAEVAADFGVHDVHLHDIVRDHRGGTHPETLSTGSSRGYVDLLIRLRTSAGRGGAAAPLVLQWLKDGLDLSMVAARFNLDPLSHHEPDREVSVINKTGSDRGVRVDAGVAILRERALVYAVLANWDESDSTAPLREDVLEIMGEIGGAIRAELQASANVIRS